MHLSLILFALGLAWSIRCVALQSSGTWQERWHRALGQFLVPPLLLLMTGLAVLCMGIDGSMLGLPAGWIGYLIAISFLGCALGLNLYLAWQGWRSLQQVQTYPAVAFNGQSGRLLETPDLFAAQIGFWRPQLVLSAGLLQTLPPNQLHAVLIHEQAHSHYRDTFCFFWFGWIRQLTFWLPNTAVLWQELLTLRELRADRWAAQRVDPLVLAESLLVVVQAPLINPAPYCAALGSQASSTQLEERINALLIDTELEPAPITNPLSWRWLFLSVLPLLSILLHS
ncbi:MAG: M48 family metalloprotease [Cyanothece sp. SIO1E1]|nr:M48 family metalloprotease [Cyanothece sp. SIO1E1]